MKNIKISVFLIAAIINLLGAVYFCVFGSGEQQLWNPVEEQERDNLAETASSTNRGKQDNEKDHNEAAAQAAHYHNPISKGDCSAGSAEERVYLQAEQVVNT